jgi:hypothetical protein
MVNSNYNPVLSAMYSNFSQAFIGVASGYLATLAGVIFSNPSANPLLGCGNLDLINTGLMNSLQIAASPNCTSSASYGIQPNATDMCPCMSYTPMANSFCQGIPMAASISSIYMVLNTTIVDGMAFLGYNQFSGALTASGASCPSCNNAIKEYVCSTAFLSCQTMPSSVNSLQTPYDAGINLITACSLYELYGFAINSLNPTPNPVLAGTLMSFIVSAELLLAASPPTSIVYGYLDNNCGCQTLSPGNSFCGIYVATPIPFFFNATMIDGIAKNLYMTNLTAITALYAPTCASCNAHLQSVICSSVFPACVMGNYLGPASTAIQKCTSSCNSDLSSCNAMDLCTTLTNGGLFSSNASTCVTYSNSIPLNCPLLPWQVTPCSTGSNVFTPSPVDGTCSPYLNGNCYVPLASVNATAAMQFQSIDYIMAGLGSTSTFCQNCLEAINELLCNMKYLACVPTNPSMTVLTLYIPSWGCMADFMSEINDCAPLSLQGSNATLAAFQAGFIPLLSLGPGQPTLNQTFSIAAAQFAANAAMYGLPYKCNSFYSTRNPVDTCPCVTLSAATLGGCAPFVNYQVSIMLNSTAYALGALGDPNIMALSGFSCPDCTTKIQEFACLSTFPGCAAGTGNGYLIIDQSICNNAFNTCRIQQLADPDVQALLQLFSTLQLPGVNIPNAVALGGVCGFFPTPAFIPTGYMAKPQCPCAAMSSSSRCQPFVTHAVVPFLANLTGAVQVELENAVLNADATVMTNCVSCKNAVDEVLCASIYPTCTDTSIASRTCLSDCLPTVQLCTDDPVNSQAICSNPIVQAALSSNSTTCVPLNNLFQGQTCTVGGVNALVPSFFLLAIAMVIKALF